MSDWVLVFYSVLAWPSHGQAVTVVVPMGDQHTCEHYRRRLDPNDGLLNLLECRDLTAHPLHLKSSGGH